MAPPTRITDPIIVELLCLLVAQATEHAFILIDPEGRIMWCNSGAERLFSRSLDEIVGRDFTEIFTERDRAAGIARLEMNIAESDAISEDDRWHRRADGSEFWSAGALVPVRNPNTGELLAFGKIVRDRTDLKTQLELATNQYEELRAQGDDKDRAITTLSHELRNVFAGMRGSIELLDTPADSEQRRVKFAQLMRRQLQMLERLIEDLLDVKRLAAGKIKVDKVRLVLQDELATIIAGIRPTLDRNGLHLEMFAPPTDVVLTADRQRVQQIFGNLLDNAMKYTPAGGKIWVKVTMEDDFAVVHVEDTGKGIPHDMLHSIFELFTQVDAHVSGGGLGVGLALVRELVILHGGSVQAFSKGIGEGSEFSVRLPLAPA